MRASMQVTTCPECDTTFKVSDEILAKADGQVRCGRCAHVFDARVALREQGDTATRSIGATAADWHRHAEEDAAEDDATLEIFEVEDAAAEPEAAGPEARSDAASPVPVGDPREAAPAPAIDRKPATDRKPAAEARPAAEAGPVTGAEPGAAPATVRASAAVGDGPDTDADTSWLPALASSGRQRWPFVVGVTLLLPALALQLVHEYSGALAANAIVGDALTKAYALFGSELLPVVDLDQYELLDLAALAEPVTADQGVLIIETRVRNNAARARPAPHIYVALLDRWQETVAGRYFAPEEYAVGATADPSSLQSAGTIDAQFVILDPGPGATGFELQICTPMAQGFACDGEAIFD